MFGSPPPAKPENEFGAVDGAVKHLHDAQDDRDPVAHSRSVVVVETGLRLTELICVNDTPNLQRANMN